MLLVLIWAPINFIFSQVASLSGALAIVAVSVFGFVLMSMGIAMIRYRLYEIDRVISRTVTYALVVGLFAVVFFGIVAVLTSLLPVDSPIVVAGSTLVVAVLFNPIRKRIQAWVDRRFNRSRYETQRVVDSFAAGLCDETDVQDIAKGLEDVIHKTLEPQSIGVWISEL